jgi:hypothetical protein
VDIVDVRVTLRAHPCMAHVCMHLCMSWSRHAHVYTTAHLQSLNGHTLPCRAVQVGPYACKATAWNTAPLVADLDGHVLTTLCNHQPGGHTM